MILNPTEIPRRERYAFLISAVVPRPVAWVSTTDGNGRFNLAPFSYFTAVCSDPMTLLFCPGVTTRETGKKDTLRNIELTGEFVVNLTNRATAQAMNRSATELPYGTSEFEWAGVDRAESEVVSAPRVAQAPVSFECHLHQIVTIGTDPGAGSAVFGRVQRIHVNDAVYRDGIVDLATMQPIGRLGGNSYAVIAETFEMARIPAPQADQASRGGSA